MEIYGATTKVSKIIASKKNLNRTYGPKIAAKIVSRISEFRAASRLSEISNLPPQRLHQLSNDLEGYFTVDLTRNVRLIFYGLDINEETTMVKDNIVSIVIKEVIDYHGN